MGDLINFNFLIPILIILIVIALLASILKLAGFDIADMIRAIAGARRTKLAVEPRDHYDRFVEGHRRSARDSKPRQLKYIWISGDREVPPRRFGRVTGYEKWMHSNIIFVRTRIISWSKMLIVPEELTSDANRVNLWVRCRGFSSFGPINMPIPTDRDIDINKWVTKILKDFRYLFEGQSYLDLTENGAWSSDQAMQPPYHALVAAAEAQQPHVTEQTYVPEDQMIGKEVSS